MQPYVIEINFNKNEHLVHGLVKTCKWQIFPFASFGFVYRQFFLHIPKEY